MAPAAHAASGPEYFGTNLQTLGAVTPSKQAGVLQQLGAAGLSVDRVEVRWDAVESKAPASGKHTYAWGGVDGQLKQLAGYGIRAAPLFRYTPGWVHVADASKPGGVDVLPASHYADFGAMVAAFAARYGDGGSFWKENPNLPQLPIHTFEIWNEVNLSEYAWNSQVNPEAYSALLKVIRPALKAKQPNGILLGALAYQENEAPDYVARMGAAGGLAALDGMGYHPYAPEAQETIRLVRHLRDELAAAGAPGLPIYANEAGQEAVVTNPDGSLTPNRQPATWAFEQFPSDAARAANLSFAGEALAASDCGVEQFLPYSVSDTEQQGGKLTEAYMGLFRPGTGAATLTAQALFRAAARWRGRFAPGGPGVPSRLALCGGGATPDGALLPLEATFTGSSPGCVNVQATYDGNPIEAMNLTIRATSGQIVSTSLTNAFGQATACASPPATRELFVASVEMPNAGRSGSVQCDVSGAGCPVGVALSTAVGSTVSAATVTGQPRTGAPVPTPTPAVEAERCTWKSTAKSIGFTPASAKKPAVVRMSAEAQCENAPKGTRLKFDVSGRAAGSKKQRKLRTLWLTNGVERRFTLKGPFKNGHVLVLLHAKDVGRGIPRLRDTVTLKVVKRRR